MIELVLGRLDPGQEPPFDARSVERAEEARLGLPGAPGEHDESAREELGEFEGSRGRVEEGATELLYLAGELCERMGELALLLACSELL